MISQTLNAEIPLVIAHRGASGYLPEHTTESAAFAHALGADFIEQDVVLSKDGVAVVLHDITLNATTNVAELFPDRAVDGKFFVFDFTWEELQTLSVSERQTAKLVSGFRPVGVRFDWQLSNSTFR
ncbi:MAG: glycerophosphodiester phosphodiesterase family protein [Planctomycetaceae bacterium]